MTRKETIRFLRGICREYEVKVGFRSRFSDDLEGEADITTETIFINKNISRKRMAQAVFHELGHIYCIRNGIWKRFHLDNEYSPIKSFKAENWIEHWAKREWDQRGMRKLFGQYKFSYLKKHKNLLILWIKEHFKIPRAL